MTKDYRKISEFEAEIREVKSKKLVSLDKEITIVLNTSDLRALELAKLDTDKTIKVSIELVE